MAKGKDNKKKKGTEPGKMVSDYKSGSAGSHSQSSIAAFAPKQAGKNPKGK
jgi:hypothetical protein